MNLLYLITAQTFRINQNPCEATINVTSILIESMECRGGEVWLNWGESNVSARACLCVRWWVVFLSIQVGEPANKFNQLIPNICLIPERKLEKRKWKLSIMSTHYRKTSNQFHTILRRKRVVRFVWTLHECRRLSLSACSAFAMQCQTWMDGRACVTHKNY